MGARRRWAVPAISLAGLLLGSLLVLVATRYYPAYRSALAARDDLRAAQALLRDSRLDASVADLATAEAKLNDAERDFQRTRQTFDDPLLRLGRRLPLLGDSLSATVHLTDIGIEGVQLGRDAIAVTRTYQQLRDQRAEPLTERTEEIIAELDPSMTAIKERIQHIQEKRERVTGAALPPSLVSAVREIDRDLEEMEDLTGTYDDLSAFLPDFLGFHGPRTYLVLAQNNAELLPTGGLISVYGIISIQDGRILEKRFEDAVSYSGRWLERSQAYVEPPAPLQRYLLRDFSWNLAVSNWSPHFPSAAQDAERFFRLAGGQPVDGVIAINVHTIEELLRVTGPITIDSYQVTVSAENALDVIEEHTRTAQEGEGDRKAFVGVLAEELLSRLMHAAPEQWTPLLEALQRLRDQRQLLFFSHDREMQMLSHRLGVDGALQDTEGDYLMLVDASVNSTKLNIVLDQRIDITVQLDPLGTARHQATVSYRNNLPAWSRGRDSLLVRRLMLGGLYGGYVRLLAPYHSRLESVTLAGREASAEEIGVERGKAVFGRFFSLPSGQQTELTFQYTTSYMAQAEDGALVYRLYLQKQPGTDAIPVRLRLLLPDGARLRSAALDGSPVASLASVETDLAEDRELVIRYELDE
ncbi:MAG: hypothetical protein A2148_12405 [Chloroflexi bacterium RBG_16_68_14]|nr:MAG: hypothetical protein A2148_12405 [Chloroflexi bacterium RBG_16_68_14]